MIRVRENADGTKRYDVRLRGSNGRVVTKTFSETPRCRAVGA